MDLGLRDLKTSAPPSRAITMYSGGQGFGIETPARHTTPTKSLQSPTFMCEEPEILKNDKAKKTKRI